jgi:hypothetical protein
MLNSDDPAYFGGYLNDNFTTFVNSVADLSPETVRDYVIKLAKNSFYASFLPKEEQERYYNEIDKLSSYVSYFKSISTLVCHNTAFEVYGVISLLALSKRHLYLSNSSMSSPFTAIACFSIEVLPGILVIKLPSRCWELRMGRAKNGPCHRLVVDGSLHRIDKIDNKGLSFHCNLALSVSIVESSFDCSIVFGIIGQKSSHISLPAPLIHCAA